MNTLSPCIGKMMCNIQELKNRLENWYKQGINYQQAHCEEEHPNGDIWRFDSTNCLTPKTPTELRIEGIGFQSNYENEHLGPLWKEMSGVLQEVTSLIERLEADRQEAEEAMQEERQKAQRLRRKQDCLSLWKQQHLPVAVQTEYETCTRDIAELKWHLKMKKDHMQQLKKALIHAETQNHQLVEDMNLVKTNDPLVRTKLLLESEVLKQIKLTQTETREILIKLSNELSSSQYELEREEVQLNNEKEMMTTELNDLRAQLKDQITELQRLKSCWDIYCNKISETKEKIVLKDCQLRVMHQQIPLLEMQETKINNAVLNIRPNLERQDRELECIKDGIINLHKQIEANRYKGKAKISESEETLSRKRQELLQLHDEIKEHEMETVNCNKNIIQSKQTVKQLQRDQKWILEKISQIEKQREQANDDLALESVRHATTKAQLEDLEQQTLSQQQSMAKETGNLKMQQMSEMKLGTLLKGNISSVTETLKVAKADCERVKQELLKEYQESSSSVAQLETWVVELREIHTVKSETIELLKSKLNDILSEGKSRSEDLEREKSVCLNHLNSVKKAHSTFSARCEQVSLRIDELSLKCEEYRKASDMMEQIAAVMSPVIEKLQSAYQMVEYKHNMAGTVITSLQSGMAASCNRTALSEEAHTALLWQRQAVMQQIKANLEKALKENVKLAKEYTELQKDLNIAKQEAVSMLNETNRAKTSFHYHKQLSLLQRRMHKAMLKYFKHRSVYSQAELAHFQALSNQNNQKMKALQEELSRAMKRISAFLQSLTDDSTTSRDATTDKQRCVDGNGLNGPKPTVQIE